MRYGGPNSEGPRHAQIDRTERIGESRGIGDQRELHAVYSPDAFSDAMKALEIRRCAELPASGVALDAHRNAGGAVRHG